MNLFLSLILALSFSITSVSHADNREATDEIFSEPSKAGWTQIFLGLTEVVAAQYAFPGLSVEANAVKATELELALTNDLPTSETQRAASIEAILKNPNNYEFDSSVGDESQLHPKQAKRIENLRSAAVITQAEKNALIEVASTNVAKAREVALKAAQGLGLVDKAVKIARVGATVVLGGDVVARIYIWNAMDANPTISPAATYLYNQIAE